MELNKQRYSSAKVVKHYADYSKKLQKPEEKILDLLKNSLKEMRMLDIGVGGGRTTVFFAPIVSQYTAIDFAEGMISACTEKFKPQFPKAKFEVGDVRDLSRFSDASFDFILFSFNGLDNISHEERIKVLTEIKRIAAPGAHFCFSSHNLLCLPVFFKIRFRFHPIKFLKSLLNRKKLIRQNKEQITRLASADYLTIYDDVYDFGLHTYYVRPAFQQEQLRSYGFRDIRMFGLEEGAELNATAIEETTDSWIYYLCSIR